MPSNSSNLIAFYSSYDIEWGQPGYMTCEVEGWCPLLPPGKSHLGYAKNNLITSTKIL